MPSMIIVVNGRLGQGKTLLMTYFAKYFMQKGLPAYTNYGVEGAESLDVLMEMRDLRDCFIGIDDAIQEGFDSYSQMGKGGKLATKLLRFLRKRRIVLCLTQQIYTGIALRVRHITNYVFDTMILSFPYFRVQGYLQDGKKWFDRIIKYSKEVYESYDTDEEVSQKIYLIEMQNLYEIANKNRTIFTDLCTGAYALNNDISKSIYECLTTRNIEALSMLCDYWGIELIK